MQMKILDIFEIFHKCKKNIIIIYKSLLTTGGELAALLLKACDGCAAVSRPIATYS